MGLKERNHLENTLSQIRKKSTKLKKIEQKLSDSKVSRTLSKNELYSSEKALESAILGLERIEEEALEAEPISQEEEENLIEISEKLQESKEKIREIRKKITKEKDRRENRLLHFSFLLAVLYTASFVVQFATPWLHHITLGFSDESEEYRCDNANVIPAWWVNDGIDDCGDNSDEDVPETEELLRAIEGSIAASDIAIGFYCGFIPLIIFLIGYIATKREVGNTKPHKSRYDLEHKSLTEENRSLDTKWSRLQTKKSSYNRKINALAVEKKRIKGLEKEVSRKKSALVAAETSVSKTETEVQTLSDEIKDHYESIKHLIPFADKLESDQ